MSKKGRMVTGNQDLIRRMNRSLIIKAIMEKESISRSELEVLTHLALPTIMRIVASLIEEGLVEEVGKGDSSGGRKPIMLKMKSDGMYFIGVGIQRVIHVVLADISGNILARYSSELKYQVSIDVILGQILKGIDKVIKQSKIDISKLMYAGIGTPATEHKHGSKIGVYPVDDWGYTSEEEWQKNDKFPCPVVFENNATLTALGEFVFGVAKNCDNFLHVTADYGVGAGVVIGGKLYTGTDGVAGEFGHTIVDVDGLPCYCGNKGCLEMYCSTSAIINLYIKDKMADPALKQKLIDSTDFILLKDAAYGGDKVAYKYITESARILGMGISGLVNMFNPEMIIIGGELPETFPEYVEMVGKSARSGIFRNKATNLNIIESELKSDAMVRGAVALAMAQVFDHI